MGVAYLMLTGLLRSSGMALKRIINVVVSGIALIILFPIFAIIGVLIKLDSRGPVFFVQERAGKDGVNKGYLED